MREGQAARDTFGADRVIGNALVEDGDFRCRNDVDDRNVINEDLLYFLPLRDALVRIDLDSGSFQQRIHLGIAVGGAI